MEMSLYLGNLSSRTCRDDLERIFWRFGRCNIQVKDKYGLIVSDYPASAEKAIKTLHGKRLCGEAINMSWSNRQPQAVHKFARSGIAYEPPHRKYSVKENVDQRLSSNNRQDYKMDSKQADGEGRKLGSSNVVDDSTSYYPDDLKGYVGERDHPYRIGGAGKGIWNMIDGESRLWIHLVKIVWKMTRILTAMNLTTVYHSDDKKGVRQAPQ